MLEPKDHIKTILIDPDENRLRIEGVRKAMREANDTPSALLIKDNANILDLTGRVFAGWIYIPLEGEVIYFVKRPIDLAGAHTVIVRKPEDIPATLENAMPESIGLELGTASWNDICRLTKIFNGAKITDASAVMAAARSVKTPQQIELIRRSGISHARVYSRIPQLYHRGMTDIELQIEIEHVSRLEGCLGQFRISGSSMEFFMGNVLTGINADTPSPYDFAMGGEGADPSLPVGANGSEILPGTTVMVDMGGNYTGYMSDMTRIYSLGDIGGLAHKAHDCSIEIHRKLAAIGTPGAEAKEMWAIADQIVIKHGLQEYYMGHRQKAGFIGHGVGIEINELPVIAPRSRQILTKGNVIALEPKFVIPGVGAVGIENTYLVTDNGMECLTNAPEEIIPLDK